ncbi:MAG: acyl-CoA dehydrogenase family protein, partial [Planctomycetota bacterium]
MSARVLEALRDSARAVGRTGEPQLAGLDETAAATRALGLVAKAGLTAWTVPAKWGGAPTQGLAADDDVSCRAMCALREPLAYHSAMLDVMLVMQGLGSYSLARSGKEAACRELLPRVACGELVAAFGLTEPGAGSDLGLIST